MASPVHEWIQSWIWEGIQSEKSFFNFISKKLNNYISKNNICIFLRLWLIDFLWRINPLQVIYKLLYKLSNGCQEITTLVSTLGPRTTNCYTSCQTHPKKLLHLFSQICYKGAKKQTNCYTSCQTATKKLLYLFPYWGQETNKLLYKLPHHNLQHCKLPQSNFLSREFAILVFTLRPRN